MTLNGSWLTWKIVPAGTISEFCRFLKAERQDPRKFIIDLFSEAFPELTQWDWQREVQRAHLFPFSIRSGPGQATARPRAILISLNFLAWEAVYELARPDRKRAGKGLEFFVRPDFCHHTVEKRWQLRQPIPPCQAKGAQVFLLNPAKLKVLYKDHTRFFTSEVQAKEFLQSL